MEELNLSTLVIKKVCSASSIYTPKDVTGERECRERWALMIKSQGSTRYYSKEKSYTSDLNHPILLPLGCSYRWVCQEGGDCSFIEFECDRVCREPISFSLKNGEKLLRLVKQTEQRRRLNHPTEELESIKDAYAALIILLQSVKEPYSPKDKREKLLPAIDYISKNYDKNINNDSLARMCGMSCVYFRKLFSLVMGTSPIAYAREIRIQKAKDALRTDHGSLTDIAFSLGYQSLYDFSRDFKKHTGKPPSKY